METPQPPHVSVSGHIVIQGQLPPASSASLDSGPPQPPRPWWKFWQRWEDFHKVTAYATLLLALGTAALAIFSLVTLLVTHADTRRLIKEARIASKQQHTDTLTALNKTDVQIAALQEQAKTMSNQLNLGRDEFAATQRPWISIESMKAFAPLSFVNGGSDIVGSFNFVLTNSGRTPALHVFPWVNPALPTTGNLSEVLSKTTEFCEARRQSQFYSTEGGISTESGILAPPNKTVTYPSAMSFQISRKDISAGTLLINGRKAINIYIGGCISYEFTFGERRRHETGFIYKLGGPETFVFVDNNTNIPANNLWLVEMDGGWAD
jgi:hypothetical protein